MKSEQTCEDIFLKITSFGLLKFKFNLMAETVQ
jgi:hypothetical protein